MLQKKMICLSDCNCIANMMYSLLMQVIHDCYPMARQEKWLQLIKNIPDIIKGFQGFHGQPRPTWMMAV